MGVLHVPFLAHPDRRDAISELAPVPHRVLMPTPSSEAPFLRLAVARRRGWGAFSRVP
jgi:hypothetical protein